MESFVILVLIVVAGLGISAAAQAGKRKPIRDAWRAAASELHLDLKPGDFFTHPEIHGEMNGHSVRVTIFTRGEGSERHTRYRVMFRSSLGLGLRIRERTVLAGVQRLLGRQELPFDDLEDRLVIRASNTDAVVGMLGPRRRHALRDFYAFFPDTVIDDTTIVWETEGVDDARDRIVENVRGVVKMADDLERWSREPELRPPLPIEATPVPPEPGAEPKRLPPETERLDAGATEDAATPPADMTFDPAWIPSRPTDGTETPMSEEPHVQADTVREQAEPARVSPPALRLRIASDHAVLETARAPETPPIAEEDDATTVAPAPADAPATVEPERDVPLQPADVSRILFASRLMGDELEREFAASFEDRRVLWPGTLRTVSTYPFDHVFGSERGARATFEIAELGDAYGARRVRAVVRLPEAAVKSLIPRVGQRLLFEGTLHRCEAFMRTLYLRDGSVPEVLSPDGQYS